MHIWPLEVANASPVILICAKLINWAIAPADRLILEVGKVDRVPWRWSLGLRADSQCVGGYSEQGHTAEDGKGTNDAAHFKSPNFPELAGGVLTSGEPNTLRAPYQLLHRSIQPLIYGTTSVPEWCAANQERFSRPVEHPGHRVGGFDPVPLE